MLLRELSTLTKASLPVPSAIALLRTDLAGRVIQGIANGGSSSAPSCSRSCRICSPQ